MADVNQYLEHELTVTFANGTSMMNDGIIPALSGVSDRTSQMGSSVVHYQKSGTNSIVVSFEFP